MMSQDQALFPSIGSVAEKASDSIITNSLNPVSSTDDDDRGVQEIESLCMSCGKQGVTRLLLTTIPYFREVIVMSFRCEHCGTHNNEIQPAGEIRPEGTMYTARILSRSDLNRQVVKSDNCTLTIPEFELTIPPAKGQLTTIEGIIRDVVRDLSFDQPLRRIQDKPTYNKIQGLIDKMKLVLADDEEDEDDSVGQLKVTKASSKEAPLAPFTVKLDDPTGNSFIEFIGSMADPKWNLRTYHRTKEQNIALGLVSADDSQQEPQQVAKPSTAEVRCDDQDQTGGGAEGQNEEIFIFPGVCSSCGHALNTYMKKVNIPYFKDIIIMSTNCDRCGYRDNEVKSGAAISEKGKRITLKVEDSEDLSRDILKSETCGLSIPEIDLVLQAGTLGGRFTTLEGILEQVYEELSDKVFAGDSKKADDEGVKAFENFLKKLKEVVKTAAHPFTLILDDPLANSYLQNLYAPDPDPNMKVVMYERSWEQNEDLGLNDMKVENYEQDAEGSGKK
ncbi:zf-ZPR1-domain-containing protein [Dentipellis sp. KUC8613]|nr:zf-ZPR1-domain-containing protein [Dentipellis sp. KUC8613]